MPYYAIHFNEDGDPPYLWRAYHVKRRKKTAGSSL